MGIGNFLWRRHLQSVCAGVKRPLRPGRCTSVYISLSVHLLPLFLPTASFFVISALMGSAESPITPQLRVCIRCARLILTVWARSVIFACIPSLSSPRRCRDALSSPCPPQMPRHFTNCFKELLSLPVTAYNSQFHNFLCKWPLILSHASSSSLRCSDSYISIQTQDFCASGNSKILPYTFILKDNSTNCTHYSVFTGLGWTEYVRKKV